MMMKPIYVENSGKASDKIMMDIHKNFSLEEILLTIFMKGKHKSLEYKILKFMTYIFVKLSENNIFIAIKTL